MGIIYEGINQIPTDKDYDIVKVVPPGKVVYNLENPNKVLFPGQRTSSKHGFKVTGEGARWTLEDIGSYVSRYSNLLDQSTVEKLKELLQLPEKQEDYSEAKKEPSESVDGSEKLSPELEIYLEGLEETIHKEKEKQEKGEEPDLDKVKDTLSDLDIVFEEEQEVDPLEDLDIVIEEEKSAKKNGFEVNFNRILQTLAEVKKKIIDGIKQIDFKKLKENSQKKQKQVEQELEETSERIKEGTESLEDLLDVIKKINQELEDSQKETPLGKPLDDLEIDLDDLIDTPELRKSLIEKELEKLENERKELEKELKEINPKEKFFLEKVLEAEKLPEEEKSIALENLKKELDYQRDGLIKSLFSSLEQVYEGDLLEFYKNQYLKTLDPKKKLQSIEKIFSFIAQSRLLKDVLEGKLPASYVLDLWEDAIGRGDVIERYLWLALEDDEFMLSFLKANGFELEQESFIAKTIYELKDNFYALRESNQLMYLVDDAADDLMIFYMEEKKEIESSVRCNEYYKLLTGKASSKEAEEFKEKISTIKEKIKNIQDQKNKLSEEAEEISAAEALAELVRERSLDEVLEEDKRQLNELRNSLGISEDFIESLYSIQPRESLFSQLLTSFQNSLSLVRGISSLLFDVGKDQVFVTSYRNRYALFEQAFRVLVDSYIGNLQASLERSKEENPERSAIYKLLEDRLKNNFETLYEASLGIALHYIAQAIYEAAIDETTGKIDYKNLVKNVKEYLLKNKVSGSLHELEKVLVYGQDELKARRCLSIPALDTSDLSVEGGEELKVSYNPDIAKNTDEIVESILENSIRLKDYFARAILCAFTHNNDDFEKLLVPLARKLDQDEETFFSLREDETVLNRSQSAIKGSSLRNLADAYGNIAEEIHKIAEYVFGIFGASVEYSNTEDSGYLKITSNNTMERLLERGQLSDVVNKLGKVIADFYRDRKVVFDGRRFSAMFKVEEEDFFMDDINMESSAKDTSAKEEFWMEDINIVSPTQEKEESPIKLKNEDVKAINDFLEQEDASITVPAKLNDGKVGDLSLVKNPDGSITASLKKDGEEIVNSIVTKEELKEFLDQQKPSQKILDKILSTAKKFFEGLTSLTGFSTQQESEKEISEQPAPETESSQSSEATTKESSATEEGKEASSKKSVTDKFVDFLYSLGYTQDESSKTFKGLKDYLSLKVNSPKKVEKIIGDILREVSKLPEQKKKAVATILHSAFNPQFIYQIDNTGIDISDKDQLSSAIKEFLLSPNNKGKNRLELGIEVELGTSLKSKAKLVVSKKKPIFQLLKSFGVNFSKELNDAIRKYNDFVEITIDRSDALSPQEKPLSIFVPEDFLLKEHAGMDFRELLSKLAAKAFIGAKLERDNNPEEKYRKRRLNAIKEAAKTGIKEDKESLKKAAEVQDKETKLRRKQKKKDKAVEYAKTKDFEHLESKINSINSTVSLLSSTANIPALERDFFSRYKDEQELQQAVSDILKDHVKYFTKAKNPSYRGALPIKINDTYVQASCSFERSLPVIDESGDEIGRYLNISIDYESPNFARLAGTFSTRIIVGEDGNLVTDFQEPVNQLFDHIKKNLDTQVKIEQEITRVKESAKENTNSTTTLSIPPPGEKTIVEVEPEIKVKEKPGKPRKSSTKQVKSTEKKQVQIETSDNGDITISVPSKESTKILEISKELSGFIDEKDIKEAVQTAAAETVYVTDIEELEEVENAIFTTSVSDPVSKKPYNVEIRKEGLKYIYTINDSSGKPVYDGVLTKLPNLKGLRTRILEDLAFVRMSSISPTPEVEQDEFEESLDTETAAPYPVTKPEENSKEKPKEKAEEKTEEKPKENSKEKTKSKEKIKEKPKKEKPAEKESTEKKKASKKQTKKTPEEPLNASTSKEEVETTSYEAGNQENEGNKQPLAEDNATDFETPSNLELPGDFALPDDFELPEDFKLPSVEEIEEDEVKYEIRSKIEQQKTSIIKKANVPSLSVVPDRIRISDNLFIDFEKEETPYDDIFDIKIKLIAKDKEGSTGNEELWTTTIESDQLEDQFDTILESILKNVK